MTCLRSRSDPRRTCLTQCISRISGPHCLPTTKSVGLEREVWLQPLWPHPWAGGRWMGPSIFGLQFLLGTTTAFLPAKLRDLPPASLILLLVVPVWKMRWEGPSPANPHSGLSGPQRGVGRLGKLCLDWQHRGISLLWGLGVPG